jgi:hypothetical protein
VTVSGQLDRHLVRGTKAAYCWASGESGQIGDRFTEDRLIPVPWSVG